MSFKEYKNLNLVQISNEVLEYWKNDNTFEKSISTRKDSKDFVFLKGPLLLTECQVYITLWQELSKIFSVDIKH